MEKEEYILNPSLKYMSLSTIVIHLWKLPDILPQAQVQSHKRFRRQWPKLKDRLEKKVSKLLLPDKLKEQLMPFFFAVGLEILKWRGFHKPILPNLYFDLNIPGQLCWTPAGRVDYRKTAEVLIKRERIDVISSYILACIYCLDDIIRIVWEKLDDDSKKLFYDEVFICGIRQPRLVVFWTDLMTVEDEKLVGLFLDEDEFEYSSYQKVFRYAARSGNIAATKYFFQKLTFEEREACLLRTVQAIVDRRSSPISHHIRYSFTEDSVCGVLYYLLSELTAEQQIQVFKEQPRGTLCCLMYWPWLDVFVKVAELMWNILPVDDCYLLLDYYAQHRASSGSVFFKVFRNFFLSAPIQYRNCIVDEIRQNGIKFRYLLHADNTEILKSVVRNVHEKGRQASIIYEAELHLCWKLIDEGKWSLLDMFISACMLSSEAKTILKSSFMNYITRFYKEGEIKRRRRVWGRFFQLIDNANVNEDNKKIIEEMEMPTRKLRRKK